MPKLFFFIPTTRMDNGKYFLFFVVTSYLVFQHKNIYIKPHIITMLSSTPMPPDLAKLDHPSHAMAPLVSCASRKY